MKQTKKLPLISVIIPVFNVEKYLRTCLNSVINQTYSCLEILLIDDGSSDKSGEICAEFARKDARIRLFSHPNSGQAVARNLGLDNARGEFVSFVDSDDMIAPDFFETLYYLIVNFKTKIAMCAYEPFSDESAILARLQCKNTTKFDEICTQDRKNFTANNSANLKLNLDVPNTKNCAQNSEHFASNLDTNDTKNSEIYAQTSAFCATKKSKSAKFDEKNAGFCTDDANLGKFDTNMIDFSDAQHAQFCATQKQVFTRATLGDAFFSTGVCRGLYARGIFHDLRFPAGQIYEDVAIFFDIFNASACACSQKKNYFYRVRAGSTVNSFAAKHLAATGAVERFATLVAQHYPDLGRHANFARCSSALGVAFMIIRAEAKEYRTKTYELQNFVRKNINFGFFMRHASKLNRILMILFLISPKLLAFFYKIYSKFLRRLK